MFCDKVCKEAMGKRHERLELRLEELMRLEFQRMRETLTAELSKQRKVVDRYLQELSARIDMFEIDTRLEALERTPAAQRANR